MLSMHVFRAVITIYGLSDSTSGTDYMEQEVPKPFVGRDGLLGKLQHDITGVIRITN